MTASQPDFALILAEQRIHPANVKAYCMQTHKIKKQCSTNVFKRLPTTNPLSWKRRDTPFGERGDPRQLNLSAFGSSPHCGERGKQTENNAAS